MSKSLSPFGKSRVIPNKVGQISSTLTYMIIIAKVCRLMVLMVVNGLGGYDME